MKDDAGSGRTVTLLWRLFPAAAGCIGTPFVQQTQTAERFGLTGLRECVFDGRTVSTRRS